MPMNESEELLIKKVIAGDPASISSFFNKYLLFIHEDIHFHMRIGLLLMPDESETSIVTAFVDFLRGFEEIPKTFSIRQLLHLFVVDRSVRRYLAHHQSEAQIQWEHTGVSLNKNRLGLLGLVYHDTEFGQRLSIVKGNEKLTPSFLSSVLMPYIEAISSIQNVCDAVLKRPHHEVTIKFISQNSPTDIKLVDAAEAINAVKEDIIPWRRKNAQRMAELKQLELAMEIRKKEIETREVERQSTREDEKLQAEIAKMKEEAEQMRLENEKRRFELQKAKLELALEIVSKMEPDLPASERYVHAMQLLPSIDAIATSPIEPKLLS
jgi:hypothetical protein